YRQRYNEAGQKVTEQYLSLQGLGLFNSATPPLTALNGTRFRGVLLQNVENMDVRLGFDLASDSHDQKADNFTLETTVTGRTVLATGGGDDTINVNELKGETYILGGSGDDTVNVLNPSDSARFTQKLITQGDESLKDDVQTVLYDDLEPILKDVV